MFEKGLVDVFDDGVCEYRYGQHVDGDGDDDGGDGVDGDGDVGATMVVGGELIIMELLVWLLA